MRPVVAQSVMNGGAREHDDAGPDEGLRRDASLPVGNAGDGDADR